VVDLDDYLGLPPNARVAVFLDVDAFWDRTVAAIRQVATMT
jgi:purine nucleosidase/pyrimidine-specific ribonucleoside hydrolase